MSVAFSSAQIPPSNAPPRPAQKRHIMTSTIPRKPATKLLKVSYKGGRDIHCFTDLWVTDQRCFPGLARSLFRDFVYPIG